MNVKTVFLIMSILFTTPVSAQETTLLTRYRNILKHYSQQGKSINTISLKKFMSLLAEKPETRCLPGSKYSPQGSTVGLNCTTNGVVGRLHFAGLDEELLDTFYPDNYGKYRETLTDAEAERPKELKAVSFGSSDDYARRGLASENTGQ